MTVMTESQILEQKELREKAIERTEVLDKVKRLFLIPDMEVMTTKMVADYYEVDFGVIQTCYNRNKLEINSDGVIKKKLSDFNDSNKMLDSFEKTQYNISFKLNGYKVTIPNCGTSVFSKRAVLRIGMLLRDSKIAQEVRTQLLNVFDNSTNENKIKDINTEQDMYYKFAKAAIDGTKEELLDISKEVFDFKNRHIKKLENSNKELTINNDVLKSDNKALAGEILTWSDRSKLNKGVRILASKTLKPFGYIYKELYDELLYKHHIGLSKRGDPPYIQHIKEEEWKLVLQSFSAICEDNGYSPTKIIG